jgi:hypothetical protein
MDLTESSIFKITLIIECPVKYREELSGEIYWKKDDIVDLEILKSICENKFDKLCSKLVDTVNEELK